MAETLSPPPPAEANPVPPVAPVPPVPPVESGTTAPASDAPKDRHVFWRREHDTATKTENLPNLPDGNLEREGYYSNYQEVMQLVDRVLSGEWEESDRARRLKERYGEGGWGRMKAWLGGECDVRYDQEAGAMRFNIGTEIARRAVNVGWKTTTTAGWIGAVGLLTGGAGLAVAGPALLGSAGGRITSEIIQGATGGERKQREKIEGARIRQYQKARELAERVSNLTQNRNETEDIMPLDGPSDTAAERRLTSARKGYEQAVKDLVNFVYASEQNGVRFEYDREGHVDIAQPAPDEGTSPERWSNEDQSASVVEPGFRAPFTPGASSVYRVNQAEKRLPHQLNQRDITSDVYQPSAQNPAGEGQTIADLEKGLEKTRKRWEWASEGLALVGGMVPGVMGLLSGKIQEIAAQQMIDKLQSGGTVHLDIDGDKIKHGVHILGSAANNMLDAAGSYVFDYNSTLEAMKAAVATGKTVPGLSHVLSVGAPDTMGILNAIQGEAAQKAALWIGTVWGGLAGRFIQRGLTNERQGANWEKNNQQFQNQSELMRRRLQPETLVSSLRREARKIGKPFPSTGETWEMVMGDGSVRPLRILDIDENRGEARIAQHDDQLDREIERFIPISEIYRNGNLVKPIDDSLRSRAAIFPPYFGGLSDPNNPNAQPNVHGFTNPGGPDVGDVEHPDGPNPDDGSDPSAPTAPISPEIIQAEQEIQDAIDRGAAAEATLPLLDQPGISPEARDYIEGTVIQLRDANGNPLDQSARQAVAEELVDNPSLLAKVEQVITGARDVADHAQEPRDDGIIDVAWWPAPLPDLHNTTQKALVDETQKALAAVDVEPATNSAENKALPSGPPESEETQRTNRVAERWKRITDDINRRISTGGEQGAINQIYDQLSFRRNPNNPDFRRISDVLELPRDFTDEQLNTSFQTALEILFSQVSNNNVRGPLLNFLNQGRRALEKRARRAHDASTAPAVADRAITPPLNVPDENQTSQPDQGQVVDSPPAEPAELDTVMPGSRLDFDDDGKRLRRRDRGVKPTEPDVIDAEFTVDDNDDQPSLAEKTRKTEKLSAGRQVNRELAKLYSLAETSGNGRRGAQKGEMLNHERLLLGAFEQAAQDHSISIPDMSDLVVPPDMIALARRINSGSSGPDQRMADLTDLQDSARALMGDRLRELSGNIHTPESIITASLAGLNVDSAKQQEILSDPELIELAKEWKMLNAERDEANYDSLAPRLEENGQKFWNRLSELTGQPIHLGSVEENGDDSMYGTGVDAIEENLAIKTENERGSDSDSLEMLDLDIDQAASDYQRKFNVPGLSPAGRVIVRALGEHDMAEPYELQKVIRHLSSDGQFYDHLQTMLQSGNREERKSAIEIIEDEVNELIPELTNHDTQNQSDIDRFGRREERFAKQYYDPVKPIYGLDSIEEGTDNDQ